MTLYASGYTPEDYEKAIGIPQERWAKQCHAISLAIVKSDLFEVARVARGVCVGVGSQHSWVVIGNDCYASDAEILDATLWSYDPHVRGVWHGTAAHGRHIPHGSGNIWEWGKPHAETDEYIELTPSFELSRGARRFLELVGPLDRRGWMMFANAPVGGNWPAAEIFAAMDDTEAIQHFVPIDVLGMVTDRNPGGLYLKPTPRERLHAMVKKYGKEKTDAAFKDLLGRMEEL